MRIWVRLFAVSMMVAAGPGLMAFAKPFLTDEPDGQRLLDQSRTWSGGRYDDSGPRETETVERTLALPTNGAVRVKNFSGDIHVTAGTGSNVVLKATRRAPREVLDHVKLEMTVSGSDVLIEANRRDSGWPERREHNDVVETQMELQVPASADLDIDAFSSDVSVDGINADQRVKTFSGMITVRGLKGEIDAETFSADIRVTLDQTSKGNISFDTFSGRLDSDLPITTTSYNTGRGRRGRQSRDVEGTLPGGAGPRLRFHTFSGDVELRQK